MSVINKIQVAKTDYDIEDSNAVHKETDPVFSASASANITNEDITNWNNKSDFSGNYNDLSNKPDLSGFITNSVNDLLNYYKKSETYTQSEINALINAITTINLQVVQELPTEDISTTTIYLVPKDTGGTNNAYDEYVYISNAWEKIGDTQVDLTGYVTTTDYATSSVGGVLKVSNGDYGLVVDEGVLKGSVKTKAQYEDASSKSLVAKGTLNNILGDYELLIDSNNKLSSDLVDDTNGTNKFVTASEKTTWNGKQDELTAGDNITIENNVISATGGGINNFSVYFYQHSYIPSSGSDVSNTAKTLFTNILNDIKDGKQVLLVETGSAQLDTNRYGIGMCISDGSSYVICYTNSTKPYSSQDGIAYWNYYIYAPFSNGTCGTISITNNRIYPALQYNASSLMNSSVKSQNLTLTTTNTATYTPTSDYNPATKKYVDDKLSSLSGYDATKTQILKNVNGTLTWVDE